METLTCDIILDPMSAFCPAAAKAGLHPTVKTFLDLSNESVAQIYCNKHPQADMSVLNNLLNSGGKTFRWSGVDLMPVTDGNGQRKMSLIEVNTCPTGNSWQAGLGWELEGYRRVIHDSFIPWMHEVCPNRSAGDLAVFIDLPKNYRECRTYAGLIAQSTGESVHLCNIGMLTPDWLRWSRDGFAEVLVSPDQWRPIRGAFRKVVDQPWVKIPVTSKTAFYNPIGACLAGGRNKSIAAMAYSNLNQQFKEHGLEITTPLTIYDVKKSDIVKYAEMFNYLFVIKVPYSNAGLGVFIITSKKSLDEFLTKSVIYDKYIVQALIAHENWVKERGLHSENSNRDQSVFYARPAKVPDADGEFVIDIRLMIISGSQGWRPACVIARRAGVEFTPHSLDDTNKISKMLKTNLSELLPDGSKQFNLSRLLSMSTRDFAGLGLTVDDLVEAYVGSVLATVAIDNLGKKLMPSAACFDWKKCFNLKLFQSINEDKVLEQEIKLGQNLPFA